MDTTNTLRHRPKATSPSPSSPSESQSNTIQTKTKNVNTSNTTHTQSKTNEKVTYPVQQMSFASKCASVLSNLCLDVFFSRVEVVNAENVPKTGPCILYGNHNNQFVDGMVVSRVAGRPISFIIAESSMHKPLIGSLARATNAVPVTRPQDLKFVGSGYITAIDKKNNVITGTKTKFMEELSKESIVYVDDVGEVIALRVLDDVKFEFKAKGVLLKPETGQHAFKVLPKVHHEQMFDKVTQHLKNGGCIGIFPEGGSHDNTKLLPLKAGVALMFLGALANGIQCQLIPVGINYFAPSQVRSAVFVDVGKPLEVSSELIIQYSNKKTRREACNNLLEQMTKALEFTVITADDFATLKIVRTARRMYQNKAHLNSKEYIMLNQQFSYAFKQFKEHDVVKKLTEEVADYLEYCRSQGLKDKQVRDLPPLGSYRTLFNAIKDVFITYFMAFFVLPICLGGLLLYVPIILYTRRAVPKLTKKALAKSSVKVKAKDVVMSNTIVISLQLIPVLLTVYSSIIVWYYTTYINTTNQNTAKYSIVLMPVGLVVFNFYLFYFCPLMFEKLARRWRLLPRYWLCILAFFQRKPTTLQNLDGETRTVMVHPAEHLRIERKKLVIRIQDAVERFIKDKDVKIEWRNEDEHRVINRGRMLRQRSKSTERLAKGDLTSSIPPSGSYDNLQALGQ